MASLIEAFILLLGIIDPPASFGAFMSFTKKMNEKKKRRIALKSVFVASLVFFVFAIFGGNLLDLLGVNIESFRAAGGIILVLLGIQMSLGLSLPKEKNGVHEVAVIIGTPLITGPATITTAILLVKESGLITTLIAGTGALLITMTALLLSTYLSRIIGVIGIRILSTIMGIITIAWGLQFILTGITNFGL
ncbi:MarC family protein [Candidatus Micrarchaeota archaeon]|nr:MarC family protein [Candidatus Micrarchaeota archaeon]MBU1165803.1 MarC family protein [Candidatus Micrarchaeota archaeon]MBU1886281.1 MarC family protein [Candidatus Micrarchaeota archaeon]